MKLNKQLSLAFLIAASLAMCAKRDVHASLSDNFGHVAHDTTLTDTVRIYRPNGQIQWEIPRKDGKNHGEMRYFDKEGQFKMRVIFEEGVRKNTKMVMPLPAEPVQDAGSGGAHQAPIKIELIEDGAQCVQDTLIVS